MPFLSDPFSVIGSHLFFAWQDRALRENSSSNHGLELKKCKRGVPVRHTDKQQCEVGSVEDIFVKIVNLCSVCDEYRVVDLMDLSIVAVIMGDERKREMIACTNDYAVDVIKY